MDAKDKQLLNRLQQGLPLKKDPYNSIAEELGLTKDDVVARIQKLVASKYIRRIGGVFDTKAMGYTSLLLGARVEEEIFYEVARFINEHPGVTHNYRRRGMLNMWFTLATRTEEERDKFIDEVKRKFGVKQIFCFPKLQQFKLRVFFDIEGEGTNEGSR